MLITRTYLSIAMGYGADLLVDVLYGCVISNVHRIFLYSLRDLIGYHTIPYHAIPGRPIRLTTALNWAVVFKSQTLLALGPDLLRRLFCSVIR